MSTSLLQNVTQLALKLFKNDAEMNKQSTTGVNKSFHVHFIRPAALHRFWLFTAMTSVSSALELKAS